MGEENDKTPKMSSKDQENIDKYKAELDHPDSKNLTKGPISDRSITDCPMCVIFLIFIVGMFVAAAYGFKNGDPRKLVIGWDADQNGCGYTKATKDFPYLYFAKSPDPKILKEMKEAALKVRSKDGAKQVVKDAMKLLS